MINQTQSQSPTVIRTESIAQKGNFLNALTVKQEKSSSWIVDLRASDHMIGNASMLRNYVPFCHNVLV